MSIVTKKGDQGMTDLMYGRRVSKCHPRIEACGAVDELNATLGLARAATKHAFVGEILLNIQKDLIALMGELATGTEDSARYVKDGYPVVSSEMTARLEEMVRQIEGQNIKLHGWATPGAAMDSAALDSARAVCRRAERSACALREANELQNAEILTYLNRLSDLLWLLARWSETRIGTT